MPALVVIGSQWGDEGKGKLIDILSSQADFVVRYQGGANAGHTLMVKGREVIVHLIPSAVFHPRAKCLIHSGVALDIESLCAEIHNLQKMGFLQDKSQLLISDSATLLLDYHKQLDQAREKHAGSNKIGTTGRGIGPAYESRTGRRALLFSDLFEEDHILLNKLKERVKEPHILLSELYNQKPLPVLKSFEKMKCYREILRPYRCQNMSLLLHKALKQNKKVLFEGAQGSLLDILHGTYPYVTSSSTLAGSVLSSCGLAFTHFNRVLAITKAYSTRVGEGPFPTECSSSPEGRFLQEKGKEFGATTHRLRRCGWLDMPALKYAIRLNGAKSLALMKLDVLTGLREIKLCIAYEIGSQRFESFPPGLKELNQVRPIYKKFKGWNQDLSSVKSKKDLPEAALEYLDFISEESKTPIDLISVGPARSQTLYLNKLF